MDAPQPLQRTPLHAEIRAAGGRLVPFAGWEMAVQFAGLLEEHRAVRGRCGLFDISHMGVLRLLGPGAKDALQALVPTDLFRIGPGEACYTVLLNDQGGIRDDLIVYDRGWRDDLQSHELLLVINAACAEADTAWLRSQLEPAGIAVADSTTGLFSAIGILTALIEREQSGRGQWVQANLLSSMIALCDFQAARYLIDGVVPPQAGNDHPVTTPMGAFQSADGYFNLGVGNTQQFRTLCDLIDRPDLRDQPEYQTNAGRLKDRALLAVELGKSFARRTTQEWVDLLNAAGVPCGPIYDMQQVFEDPQVQHLPTTTTLEHPRRGPIRVLNQPVILSRTPAQVTRTQCEAGAHNHEILGQLGFSENEIEQFIQQKVI